MKSFTMMATGTITNMVIAIRRLMPLAALLPVSKLRLARLIPAVKLKTKCAALKPVKKSPQKKFFYFCLAYVCTLPRRTTQASSANNSYLSTEIATKITIEPELGKKYFDS